MGVGKIQGQRLGLPAPLATKFRQVFVIRDRQQGAQHPNLRTNLNRFGTLEFHRPNMPISPQGSIPDPRQNLL
jgi:hypothetical protein